MKKFSLLTLAVAFLLTSPRAFALGGCADSPENPTLLLAGLAGGVFGARYLRTYMRARKGR